MSPPPDAKAMTAPRTGTRSAGICEDDDALRGVLRNALERDGLTVRATASGTEALRTFGAAPPDVLLLDIALPDADGRDLCQALRARGVTSPMLFLTAKDALPDRISGFHAGGDDYLTKPFALAELLVRVHALLRRADGNGRDEADGAGDDGLALDPVAHAVAAGGQSLRLTPTEFRVLAALAGRRGAVLRRSELVAAAWPEGAMVHDNTLDAYIARIRRKLRELGAPDAVETVRGVGYVLR